MRAPPRRVTLWDVRASLGSFGASLGSGARGKNTIGGAPVAIGSCTPHSKGIYSLHEVGGRVLTGSKDGSCALSLIVPTGLKHARTFDADIGTLRSVRWRDEHLFACGGREGHIALIDTRAPSGQGGGGGGASLTGQGASVRISSALENGVSDLRWSPRADASHLLLSSGPGLEMRLHDVRATREPVVQFSGHARQVVAGYSIYTPTWSHDGRAVSACGRGSNRLSLFDVASGALAWEATLKDDDGDNRAALEGGAQLRSLRFSEEEDELLLVATGKRVEVHGPRP